MDIKELYKHMIFENPNSIKSPWDCLCEIFANNHYDFDLSKTGIVTNFKVNENPVMNKNYLYYLENKFNNNPTKENKLLFNYAKFNFEFIERNIHLILNSTQNSFSLHQNTIGDFNLTDNSNFWKITPEFDTAIKNLAVVFGNEVKHLLWSKASILGTKESPLTVQAWNDIQFMNVYIKVHNHLNYFGGDQ